MAVTARGIVDLAGTFVVALILGVLGGVPVFALGLAVPEYIVLPLTLGFGGLVAGLTAAWVANLIATDDRRSRILATVAWSEVAAVIALAALLIYRLSPWQGLLQPNAVLLVVAMIPIAGAASLVAWRRRTLGRRALRDVSLTLGLILLGLAAVAIAVAVGCSVVLCVA